LHKKIKKHLESFDFEELLNFEQPVPGEESRLSWQNTVRAIVSKCREVGIQYDEEQVEHYLDALSSEHSPSIRRGPQSCPSEETLNSFSVNQLSPSERAAVCDHLSSCLKCRKAVRQIQFVMGTFFWEDRDDSDIWSIERKDSRGFLAAHSALAPSSPVSWSWRSHFGEKHICLDVQVFSDRLKLLLGFRVADKPLKRFELRICLAPWCTEDAVVWNPRYLHTDDANQKKCLLIQSITTPSGTKIVEIGDVLDAEALYSTEVPFRSIQLTFEEA